MKDLSNFLIVKKQKPLILRNLSLISVANLIFEKILRRRKILLSFDKIPQKINFLQKISLVLVDGVIAEADVFHALLEVGVKIKNIFPLREIDISAFMSCPITRNQESAFRIVYAGDFSPYSGVTDFFACMIAWAEIHPDIKVDIVWLGDGDLRGVLHAQLTPSNLKQEFLSISDRVEAFCKCGILVVPNIIDHRSSFVIEALAAGLAILGSIKSAQVRSLINHKKVGWIFDPLNPKSMFFALDSVFSTKVDTLNEIRIEARDLIYNLYSTDVAFGTKKYISNQISLLISQSSTAQT